MRLNHAIKKIAAVGTGAMLLGMSAAAAVDLSDYPRPFIEQGEFSGSFVVGANAIGIDTVGMTEIAMSLQAAATVPIHEDGEVGEVVLEDSFRVASGSTNLLFGRSLDIKSTLTEDDLDMLRDVTFTDEDGTSYDAQFRVNMPVDSPITFSNAELDRDEDPNFYVDFSAATSTWSFDMTFPDGVNFDDFKGERIHILGEEYVFGQGEDIAHEDGLLTLYKSGVERVIEAGSPQTLTVDGESVTINVLGANANVDPATATILIGNDQRTVREGRFYTIGGVRVFIDDIFIINIPEERAQVRVFLGADKLILEDEQEVRRTVGSTDERIRGTNVEFTGDYASEEDVTRVRVSFTPNEHRSDFSEVVNRDKAALALGEEYVDPVFGQIKFAFTDVVPGMTSAAKEHMSLRSSGDRMRLTVSNYNGVEYDLTVLRTQNRNQASTDPFDWAYDYYHTSERPERIYVFEANGDDVAFGFTDDYTVLLEDNRFIVREDGQSEFTRFMELTDIDQDDDVSKIRLLDLGTGNDREWQTRSGETFAWDGTDTFEPDATGDYQYGVYSYDGVDYGFLVNSQAATPYVVLVEEDGDDRVGFAVDNKFVTRRGAVLWFEEVAGEPELWLQEDSDFNADTPRNFEHGVVTVAFDWDGDDLTTNGAGYLVYDGSDYVASTVGTHWSDQVRLESNDDVQHAITVYGTTIAEDTDRGNVDIFYPRERVYYNVFVGPAAAGTGVGGGEGTIVGEAINPIAVGAAILDTEAAGLVGTSNLIVVGGPCANDVAMELMGNPADCVAGFTLGEGRIKLFENPDGTVSLLVAGYSGADTRLAARVLASYAQHEGRLVGDEVVVTGTTIANVDISAPVMTEDDWDDEE